LRVETEDTPFTMKIKTGTVLRMPVAHGEGSYFADRGTIADLETKSRVVFRYVDQLGNESAESNPNGSLRNIAGICNEGRNVVGMMPHPDRAWDRNLGSEDGKLIFGSLIEALETLVA
jgi:phosphoribosylformylglycinamidine synthase subunit PurQ / glutaminase